MRHLLPLFAAICVATPAVAQIRLPGTGDGAYAVGVVSWRELPFRTVVRQHYDYSCGSAAVATLLKHHFGQPIGEEAVFRAMYAKGDQTKIRRVGFSLLDMKRYLQARGFKADGYRATLDKLEQNGKPAIALIDLGSYRHFVVIKGVRGDQVLVGDPALGLNTHRRAAFEKMWNGVAFVVEAPDVQPDFNAAREWAYLPQSPLGRALDDRALDTLGLDAAPIHQITPVFVATGS